jgi:hypothetical protein
MTFINIYVERGEKMPANEEPQQFAEVNERKKKILKIWHGDKARC